MARNTPMNKSVLWATLTCFIGISSFFASKEVLAPLFDWFFLSSTNFTNVIAAIWIGAPKFVFYFAWGMITHILFRNTNRVFRNAFILSAMTVIWRTDYPDGIWISGSLDSFIIAYIPILFLIVGFVFGFYFCDKLIPESVTS